MAWAASVLVSFKRRSALNRFLVRWLIGAVTLLAIARLVPGFHVRGLGAALLAALVIGFINGTLGTVVRILTLPLSILTLGLFLLVVNALMLELSSWFVPGFSISGFAAAFWGALILSVVHLLTRELYRDSKR
jgi:putative membrane protein